MHNTTSSDHRRVWTINLSVTSTGQTHMATEPYASFCTYYLMEIVWFKLNALYLIFNCYCLIWPRTNYNTDYMGFFRFSHSGTSFFIYLTIQGIITFKLVYIRTKYSAKRIIEFEFWFSLWCLINKAWSKYRYESLNNISETQSLS